MPKFLWHETVPECGSVSLQATHMSVSLNWAHLWFNTTLLRVTSRVWANPRMHWVTDWIQMTCQPYGFFMLIILILRIKTPKWHTNRPKYQHGPQRNSNKCSHQWKRKHPCSFEELLKWMNHLNVNIWTTDCNSSIIIESSQQGETI